MATMASAVAARGPFLTARLTARPVAVELARLAKVRPGLQALMVVLEAPEEKQPLRARTHGPALVQYIAPAGFMVEVQVARAVLLRTTSTFSVEDVGVYVLSGALDVHFPQQAQEICKWKMYYLIM